MAYDIPQFFLEYDMDISDELQYERALELADKDNDEEDEAFPEDALEDEEDDEDSSDDDLGVGEDDVSDK